MLKATRSDRPPLVKKQIRKNNNNTDRPKNFNSGYFRKYILYIIIFILLLFFSFIFFAPMFINLKVWKPEIISMLEENTGKTARIKGDIELKIYPSPQVKVHNISLIDEESGVINNFLRSDSVIAKLSFLPLLKGDVIIESIIFDNLTINLLNTSNQKPNWVFEKKIKNSEEVDELVNEQYSKFNQIKYPNIRINEYRIIDGAIIYNNTSKIDIENINIITGDNLNIIDGKLNVNGNDFFLNSTFNKDGNKENTWLTNLSIKNSDINIKSDVSINYVDYFPNISGNIEVSYDNIEKIFSNNSIKYLSLIDQKTKFTGDLSLSFNNNNLYYSIFNINSNMGEISFTGALSGNNGMKPEIEIALSSNNLDLDAFIEHINNINKDYNINVESEEENYWDKYSGNFIFSIGTSKLLDYPIRNISIEIDKEQDKYFLKSSKATFPGNTNINFDGVFKNKFSIFEGSGELVSDNIRDFYRWLSIDLDNISDSRLRKTNLKSDVVFRQGGATFAAIKGKIDSSDINGEVRLRFGDLSSALINLKIDKLNLDSYLNKNEEKQSERLNKYNLLNFDLVNFDIELQNLLLFKNKYNNIIFKNSYKNNQLTIEKLDILDFAGGKLSITGLINYQKKDSEYNLNINLNHKDFSEIYDFYEFPKIIKDLTIGNGSLQISSQGNSSNFQSNLLFENLNTKIEYNGEIKIQDYSVNDFDGEINISVKDINSILDLNGDGVTNFSSDISKNNKLLSIKNININNPYYKHIGNIIIDNEKENIINFDLEIDSTTLDILTIKNIYNYFYNNTDQKVIGNFKLDSELININKYQIHDFDFLLSLDEDLINVKKVNGKLYGGSINADGKIFNNNLFEYTGRIIFKNIQTKEFFKDYFSFEKFNSEISSELFINGKANNFEEFFDSMQGEGEIKFTKNLFKGMDTSKIIDANSIKDEDNLINHVYESFNSNKEKKIDDFILNYTYENNNVSLQTFEIKVDDFFTLLDGKLNFKTRDYFISSKFFLNNDLDNFLSLDLSRKNNAILHAAESSSSIINTDINAEDNKELINTNKANSNFENLVNNLSDESLIENIDQDLLYSGDNNEKDSQLVDNNQLIQNSEIVIIKPELPEFFKNIETSVFINYFKPNVISNDLILPKLPTEEDILDELLDSVLSPND